MHEASFELIEIPHVRCLARTRPTFRMVVDALDLCSQVARRHIRDRERRLDFSAGEQAAREQQARDRVGVKSRRPTC